MCSASASVSGSGSGPLDLSVVVPVLNEADNITPLLKEIHAALEGHLAYEIIYVDDGSTDATLQRLLAARQQEVRLRVLHLDQRCGQSTAILCGVRVARAPWIATLDGDLQNDPRDILTLWQTLRRAELEGKACLVVGRRLRRRDNWLRRLSSRTANAVRSRALRDNTADTGSGLKLYPRQTFLELPYFDHMHRFLPALFLRQGAQVHSVPVRHRPRQAGQPKYGVRNRLWVGIIDLLGVMWLQRRTRRPVVKEITVG